VVSVVVMAMAGEGAEVQEEEGSRIDSLYDSRVPWFEHATSSLLSTRLRRAVG
jgi:hypothetical protein